MVEKYKPAQGCRGRCINCNDNCRWHIYDASSDIPGRYNRHRSDPMEFPCQCKTYPYCLNAKLAVYTLQDDAEQCPNACWRCYKPCRISSSNDEFEKMKHAAETINCNVLLCECQEYPNCERTPGVIKNYQIKEKESRKLIYQGGKNKLFSKAFNDAAKNKETPE